MRLAFVSLIASAVLVSCAAFAQQPLPVETIRIDTAAGPQTFRVEIASDHASQERGLMFRSTMDSDAGMLFDLHQSERIAFWMKNTELPLDMLFIRADGTVSSIEPNAVPYSTDPIPSAEPVRAVLEINGGRAYALGIRPGDRVHATIFHNIDTAAAGTAGAGAAPAAP
ncbi:MAG TPA: DUF192 domain-containing protein [Rhizomicrobium sp.]|nr:DUF192 domain-containing protein [Rhizomicrobium sp.]